VRARRILFALSNSFSDEQVIGGAELGTLVVMKELKTINVEPYVVMHGSGHFGELLRREGIAFEVVQLSEPVSKLSRNRSMASKSIPVLIEIRRLATSITRVVERWKIDILHANHHFGYIACGMAAKFKSIPSVWHLHEGWDRNAISRVLEIAGPFLADHIVTIAPYEQSTVASLTSRVAHTLIEHAFDFSELERSVSRSRQDIREELGIGSSEILIGYVSHLAPYKGQRTFVRALTNLASEGLQFKAIIVGGPRKSCEWFRDELQAEVRELALSGQIIFCGTRLDIPNIMNAIDIFACVSTSEEFNRVLIEAMCFGKPVIASDLRGGSIVAESGRTGLLVPPDNVESLSVAIKSLLDSSTLRATLGANGRAYARERFSIAALLPKYECLYDLLTPPNWSGRYGEREA
jgi:glycosyltransferase involved in cell wall biosynthesis